MRKFENRDRKGWRYGELQVIEPATGKEFTLTQPKTFFDEDCYHIKRTIAVQNVPADVVPEPSFYVCEVAYMIDGCCLRILYVGEEAVECLIKENVKAFMEGKARDVIEKYFE